MSKKLLSIVTTCFNEEENVADHFDRVSRAIAPFKDQYDFEHIYTDNNSTDKTWELLAGLAKANSSVRVMRFSRNVGANRAAYQALVHARGDAAIFIQGDLQDPPEMIPEFIKHWQAGYDVVYGKIQKREEGFLLRNGRKLYYRLIAAMAEVAPPQNAGDFRLTSRRVLDALKTYNEDDIYIRGVIAHIGFPQKALPYERAPRMKGKTSTSFIYLVGYALNGLVSTSLVPLRFVTLLGFFTALVGFLYSLYIVGVRLLFPDWLPTPGVTTIVALMTFFAGVQLFALGMIGEYIRKIYLQSLDRPQAFIRDQVNLESAV